MKDKLMGILLVAVAGAQPLLATDPWVAVTGGIAYTGGNVGIGTTSPTSILHLEQNLGSGQPVRITQRNTNAAGFTDFFMFNSEGQYSGFQIAGSGVGLTQFGLPQANMAKFISSANVFAIGTSTSSPLVFGTSDAERIRILADGRVLIGTQTPSTEGIALEVVGKVRAGNIAAHFQDIAEWVPATNDMPPGTVVVLNPARNNEVMPSQRAYDTAVAGVVSAAPGLILGEESDSKAQVATTGRVKVLCDATQRPIRVGDLLVTSDKPGVAMRSEPIEIQGRSFHQPGTLIGKALEPLVKGEGEVLVLLSLQ